MKLTANFHQAEFMSHDGSSMPNEVLENIKELAKNLEVIRDAVGKPIRVNSGYRSPRHNARIGGVKNSYHTKGMAADLVVQDLTPKQLARIILKLIKEGKIKQGGVGLYNGFVHYDIRGTAARWDNSSWYNFI